MQWDRFLFFVTKNYVKSSVSLSLLSRNIFKRNEIFYAPIITVEKLTLANEQYRQINHLVILLVKALLSRKFCQKRVRVNFRNFHSTVHYAFIIP